MSVRCLLDSAYKIILKNDLIFTILFWQSPGDLLNMMAASEENDEVDCLCSPVQLRKTSNADRRWGTVVITQFFLSLISGYILCFLLNNISLSSSALSSSFEMRQINRSICVFVLVLLLFSVEDLREILKRKKRKKLPVSKIHHCDDSRTINDSNCHQRWKETIWYFCPQLPSGGMLHL